MKINDTQRIGGAYRAYPQTAEHRLGGTMGKRRKDEVAFSSEAMELLGAQNKTDEKARSQRIERLKQEVSTGTYNVDVSKIADKMAPFFYPVYDKE